jgi:hypothetical protein
MPTKTTKKTASNTTVTESITDSITGSITDSISRNLDRFGVSKLTHVDLSSLDLRRVDLPKFDLPKFDLPKFDMPVQAERVAAFARDAAYVGVGAAVVAGQEIEQRVRAAATRVADAVR